MMLLSQPTLNAVVSSLLSFLLAITTTTSLFLHCPFQYSAAAFFQSPVLVRSRQVLLTTSFALSSSSYKTINTSKTTTMMATSTGTTAANSAPFTSLEEYSTAYKSLLEHLRTISHLNHAASVLNYDRQVFMPQSDMSAVARGKQLATLASIAHDKSTDPQLGQWITEAMQDFVKLVQQQQLQQQQQQQETESSNADGEILANVDDLQMMSWQWASSLADAKRLLELEKEAFRKQTCIPSELAAKRAELEASANHAWVKARQNNDYASFAPLLKECFDTASEIANLQRSENDDDPKNNKNSIYSQMLDEFEMGMSSERIDALFQEVQSALVPFIAQVRNSSFQPSLDALTLSSGGGKRKFPIDAQQEASRTIVHALGFDNARGRMDVSVHPFTMTLSRHDVRITSRFNEEEWYQGLMGTIHEGGHAMYEQNLLSESDLSIDTPLSMGVHESQSLFWERHIGKSKEFYIWAHSILKKAYHIDGAKDEKDVCHDGEFEYSPEELYAAVNTVDFTNLIRVDADELTYPLHVILRYNIERDIISGNLRIEDIPARWNRDMEDLLGVKVPDDTRGCLQDIHWSCLAIGYFPTYLIGAIMAAQLSHYCHMDIPNMDNMIMEGRFDEIREWLKEKVHVHGKRYPSLDDLLVAQVGEQLNTKYFIDYLTGKYSNLYKII